MEFAMTPIVVFAHTRPRMEYALHPGQSVTTLHQIAKVAPLPMQLWCGFLPFGGF